jgi:hypothetical protein
LVTQNILNQTILNSVLGGDLSGTTANATIVAGAVTKAKMADGTACSVIGRSANSTGVEADISSSANGQYLQRQSNVLSFAKIAVSDVAVFTSYSEYTSGSGTFTVPAGVTAIYIVMIGGGGGKGPGVTSTTAGYISASSGGSPTVQVYNHYNAQEGGSGGIIMGWLAVTPADSVTYSVGAAGSNSSTGTSNDATNGSDSTITYNSITTTAGGGKQGYNWAGGTDTGEGGTVTLGSNFYPMLAMRGFRTTVADTGIGATVNAISPARNQFSGISSRAGSYYGTSGSSGFIGIYYRS